MVNKFEVLQVEKSFGLRSILKNVDFECHKGEILGIFGRNGCGKSTLLRIIFGELKYDHFVARLNNENYYPEQNIEKQQIAYLPQYNILPQNKKVREIVSLFYPNTDDQDRVLYNPKIARFDSRKFAQLSGGEKRYFEMVLFSLLPHSVLIFDEPFSLIDPIEQELISALLLNLKKNKMIIITDHYYRNVLNITDQNVLLTEGNCRKVNSVDELIQGNYLKNSLK